MPDPFLTNLVWWRVSQYIDIIESSLESRGYRSAPLGLVESVARSSQHSQRPNPFTTDSASCKSANGMDRLLSPAEIVFKDYTAAPEKHPMDTTTPPLASIGIDIGKEVFHIVGLSTDGKIAFRRKIKRLALGDRNARRPGTSVNFTNSRISGQLGNRPQLATI
jgi:hypothetical protein